MRAKSLFAFIAVAFALMAFAPVGVNAVGVGKACGGFPGPVCDAGLFCEKKPGTCNVIDMRGTCTKIPQVCTMAKRKNVQPVCGCNGQTYNNDCERRMASMSKNHNGKCKM